MVKVTPITLGLQSSMATLSINTEWRLCITPFPIHSICYLYYLRVCTNSSVQRLPVHMLLCWFHVQFIIDSTVICQHWLMLLTTSTEVSTLLFQLVTRKLSTQRCLCVLLWKRKMEHTISSFSVFYNAFTFSASK